LSSDFFTFETFFLTVFSDVYNMEEKGKRRKRKVKELGKTDSQIVERIDAKLSEIGMSRPELIAEIKKKKPKFALNTIANWAARKTIPAADIAISIADTLKCSVRWLITGDSREEIYTPEEKNLVINYRNLDEQGRFEIKTLIKAKQTVIVDKETIPEIITAEEKKRNTG